MKRQAAGGLESNVTSGLYLHRMVDTHQELEHTLILSKQKTTRSQPQELACFKSPQSVRPTNLEQPRENGVAERETDWRVPLRQALDDYAQIAQRLFDLGCLAQALR